MKMKRRKKRIETNINNGKIGKDIISEFLGKDNWPQTRVSNALFELGLLEEETEKGEKAGFSNRFDPRIRMKYNYIIE